jgi:hypothetical protein
MGFGVQDPFASLVSGLTPGGRAAYPFLRSMALQEPPLDKQVILDVLKAEDLGIRRQTGLDLIDLVRNTADVSQFIRTFGENAIIPNALHTLSPTGISGGNKVQYVVGTNSTNPLIPEAIYVNAPAGLSANQIYAEAKAAFTYEEGSGMSKEDLGDVIFTIDDARFAPGQQIVGGFEDFTGLGGA